MVAAYNGKSGLVRLLLELGADHTVVGTGDVYQGKTALETADYFDEEEVVAVLREWLGKAPLIKKSKEEMYEALSEEDKAKADEARGRSAMENGKALREAAVNGQTAEVRVLLAAGTDPDAAARDGGTALPLAAWKGHEEAAVALVEGGADLDKVDNDGETALMTAANNGHSGVVRRLLELGADHTAVGTRQSAHGEGKTALEVAEEKGKEEAAAVLRQWAASH